LASVCRAALLLLLLKMEMSQHPNLTEQSLMSSALPEQQRRLLHRMRHLLQHVQQPAMADLGWMLSREAEQPLLGHHGLTTRSAAMADCAPSAAAAAALCQLVLQRTSYCC
jgi:hypothetical protein